MKIVDVLMAHLIIDRSRPLTNYRCDFSNLAFQYARLIKVFDIRNQFRSIDHALRHFRLEFRPSDKQALGTDTLSVFTAE